MENKELLKKCMELCYECIEDCKLAVTQNQVIPGLNACSHQCLTCAYECESAIRSGDFEKCVSACANCAAECEHHAYDHCRKAAASCRKFQLTYIIGSYKLQQPIHHHYGNAKA